MTCPKCNADIGELEKCPNCDVQETETTEENTEVVDVQETETAEENTEVVDVQETTEIVPAEAEVVAEEVAEEVAPPAPKKKKKGKIIIAIVAVLLVIAAAVAAFFIIKAKNSADDFVQRTLYFKENSMYYLDPDTNSPVLITEKFFKDDEAKASDLLFMNAFDFKKDGKKVFYAEKVELENNSFSLYCKDLADSASEPIKIAEDVVYYVADAKGETVIYLDVYGNLYSHNLTERSKIISEADQMWFSKDCTKILYLLEDGGLYIQTIGGEKDKIDSDVTSVEKTGENLERIYYFKDKELYVKNADADKLKIDKDVEKVVLYGDNGGVYYTKVNEVKGEGNLMDYVNYPEDLQESDEELSDDYYYKDWRTRNEALLRLWSKSALEEIEAETYTSLYYFNGESNDLINDAFVECEASTAKSGAIVIRSFDSVEAIKEIEIADVVNALDEKEQFRAGIENGKTFYRSDIEDSEFFDEFSKTIIGAMETDATYYLIKDGKAVEIKTDAMSLSFAVNNAANTIYYIDKFDEEKGAGELREVKIKDGAVESNTLYDSNVAKEIVRCFNESDVIYTKDRKDDKYDLYLNKQLVEYDVSSYSIENDGKDIIYYTDYDSEEGTGILYVYRNGEKKKIAADVYSEVVLENGDILYYQNYSKKSGKGDLYIYSKDASTRIDYDVSAIYNTLEGSRYNFLYSYTSLWADIEVGPIEIG